MGDVVYPRISFVNRKYGGLKKFKKREITPMKPPKPKKRKKKSIYE